VDSVQQAPVLEAQKSEKSPLHLKTVIMTLVVIWSSVIGNYALARGMRQAAPDALGSPLGYIAVLFDPWVAFGVTLLVVWLLSQMLLLSWADLSYVLPVTSVGYVLSAISGRLFLGEQISTARWAGVTLIMAGVVLVGRTQHSTTGERDP
jgi:uncharacterized membrane protein